MDVNPEASSHEAEQQPPSQRPLWLKLKGKLVGLPLIGAIVSEVTFQPKPQLVTDEQVWPELQDCSDVEVLDALQTFGSLLIQETQNRTNLLDTKASTLLGWNAAAAAVFLAALPRVPMMSGPRWLMVAGSIGAGIGAILAFLALRVQEFRVPSQVEWLDKSYCDDLLRLRRVQLVYLRRWHQGDSLTNRKKAHWTKLAQWCLVVVAWVFVTALLLSAFPQNL